MSSATGNCWRREMFYALMTPAKAIKVPVLFAWLLVATVALLIASSRADAALDSYGLGDGHEGAATVTQSSPLNHVAPLALAASAGDSALSTGPVRTGASGSESTTGSQAQTQFEVGRLVLIIQSAGLTPPPASGDQAPIDLSTSGTGAWELARVTAISGDPGSGLSLEFDEPLERDYSEPGAQVIAVPEFSDVTVEAGGAWLANPWDGSSGGITAFLAAGAVVLDGSVGADGAGFRGGLLHNGDAAGCTQLDGETGGGKGEGLVSGAYPGSGATNASRGNLANGAGGGNCSNAGGGGGSNAGAGGGGGFSFDDSRDVGGMGGAKLLYSAIDHAVFGGGGGAGDENNENGGAGGAGGGFVLVRGNSLSGAGSISANGDAGTASAPEAASDGAGGGGAGGVVSARFAGSAECGAITANGGAGGNEESEGGVHGPGGGGGGGIVLLQASAGSCAASADNGVAGVAINGVDGFRGSTPTAAGDPQSTGSSEPAPPGGLTAPGITLDSPADGEITNDATPTISGTSEPLARIRIVVDSTSKHEVTTALDGSWSWQPASDLTDGTHTVRVRAIAFGIAGSAEQRSFTVDTVAPEAPSVSGPDSPTNSTDAEITFSAGAGTDYLACALDLEAPATCPASPAEVDSLSDAEHTYTVTAFDLAGNSTSTAVTWTVDTVVPTLSITSPQADDLLTTRDPELVFDAEAGSTTSCSVDGGTYESCVSPFFAHDLTDDDHYMSLQAVDAAGNIATATVSFAVDATAPTATIDSGPAEGSITNQTDPTFAFSTNEAGELQCSLDGADFAACNSSLSPDLGPSPDGQHTFSVRATDLAGNVSTVVTRTWTVDTIAPDQPAIEFPADQAVVQDSTPQLSGTAESGSTVRIYVDGNLDGEALATGGGWTRSIDAPLTDSIYEFTATATDAAGNVSNLSDTVDVRIDAADPTASIQGKPGALVNSSSATFNFTADEAATFTCSLDGSPFGNCSPPVLLPGLADGTHTFRVIAHDVSGHPSSVTAYTWKIDTTPPVVTVTQDSPPPGVSPTFTFVSNESGTTYKCRVNGSGGFLTCSSPFNAPALPIGSHLLELRATDSVGNTASKTIAFAVRSTVVDPPVDPNPPKTTCDGFGNAPGVPPQLAVTAVAGGPGKRIAFTINSDTRAIARLSIKRNAKTHVSTSTALSVGRQKVTLSPTRSIPAGKRFNVRISAISLTGGKSSADALLERSRSGRFELRASAGASPSVIVQSSLDCAKEAGARRISLAVTPARGARAASGRVKLKLRSSAWAIAATELSQNSNSVSRKVVLLRGKRFQTLVLMPGSGAKLASGRATVKISTISVDGVRQIFRRQISLK